MVFADGFQHPKGVSLDHWLVLADLPNERFEALLDCLLNLGVIQGDNKSLEDDQTGNGSLLLLSPDILINKAK